jgi:hypothetical protein
MDDFRDGGNCTPTAYQAGDAVDQEHLHSTSYSQQWLREQIEIEVIGRKNNRHHGDY